MAICKCPAAAALPNIPNFTCAESFGQIQKVAFQRLYKSTGEKNFIYHDGGYWKKALMDAVVIGIGRDESCRPPVYPSTDSRRQAHPGTLRQEKRKRWAVLKKLLDASQPHYATVFTLKCRNH